MGILSKSMTFAAAAAIHLAVAGVTAASAQDLTVLRSGHPPAGALAIARHQGEDSAFSRELAKHGFKVEFAGPFRVLIDSVQAVQGGSIEFSTASITAAISVLGGSFKDVTVYARKSALEDTSWGLVAGRDSGIRTLEELKGRKIASSGASTDYFLLKALAKVGLTESDVDKIRLTTTAAQGALASGHVDAWVTWSPFTKQAIQEGAREIAKSRDVGSADDAILWVKSSVARDNPQAVAAYFKAVEAQQAHNLANVDEAVRITTELTGVTDREIILGDIENDSGRKLEPITAEVAASYQELADYLFENDLVPARVDISGHVLDVSKLAASN